MTTDRQDAAGASEEREHAAAEVADQLRRRGVHLTGHETDEQLVDLLEAVESFESAVQQAGGDLMVDEPVGRADSPTSPDDGAFVLPRRGAHESIDAFLGRVAEASAQIGGDPT